MKSSARARFVASVWWASAFAVGPGIAQSTGSVTSTPVAFGSYNALDARASDSVGSVTFNSTGSSPLSIMLSAGRAAGFSPRHMSGGSCHLGYNLYLDAARTTIWGDGTGGTAFYTSANSAAGQNVVVSVYGRIPARQNVAEGSYADDLLVTLEF